MRRFPSRTVLRTLTVALAAAPLLLFAGCKQGAGGCPPKELVKQGDLAPDMTLLDPSGTPVQLSSLIDGKVALVDVWATWCAPCIAAKPTLQALHNQFKDRGFTVVGVMIDSNAKRKGAEYIKEHPTSFPNLLDEDSVNFDCAWGQSTGIPLLVLLDRDRKVIDVWQGVGDLNALKTKVEELFSSAAPAAAPAA